MMASGDREAPREPHSGQSEGGHAGSPSGRLSRVDVGPRAMHVQTELAGAEPTRIVTVVVVDGRVRQRVVTSAPLDVARERLEQLISAQHDRVAKDLRRKVSSLESTHDQPPEADLAREARADVLSELHRRTNAEDYRGAIALLEHALASRPDEWLWTTHLCVLRRKLNR